MIGQKERRFVSTVATLVLIASAARGFSEEAQAHPAEFFSTRAPQLAVEAPAPLFAMSPANEDNAATLMARARAAASPTPETQYQPGLGVPRTHLGRSPFESQGNALFTTMGVGMFVSAASDLATTELGLATPGMVEMNPVQGNRGVRIATHVAVPALVYWATERARKNGNGKLALLIRIGANVAYSYAAMHNARTMAGHP